MPLFPRKPIIATTAGTNLMALSMIRELVHKPYLVYCLKPEDMLSAENGIRLLIERATPENDADTNTIFMDPHSGRRGHVMISSESLPDLRRICITLKKARQHKGAAVVASSVSAEAPRRGVLPNQRDLPKDITQIFWGGPCPMRGQAVMEAETQFWTKKFRSILDAWRHVKGEAFVKQHLANGGCFEEPPPGWYTERHPRGGKRKGSSYLTVKSRSA